MRPALGLEVVRRAVSRSWGFSGLLQPLPAEVDQNFRLDAGKDGLFVVKIARSGQPVAELELQNAALRWLASRWRGRTPDVVPSPSGKEIMFVLAPNGVRYPIRLLTYLRGTPLSAARPLDRQSLFRLGSALGDLDRELIGFRHAAMERNLSWDLSRCLWISDCLDVVSRSENREVVQRFIRRYRDRVEPFLGQLPASVIHNDANDENLLLEASPGGGWRVAGLLDFGDMLRSHRINELAIAAAYAMFGAPDPVEVLAEMAGGYHGSLPLQKCEVHSLFLLVSLRLCVSVVSAALAAREDPENAHRQQSAEPAWRLLESLDMLDGENVEELLISRLFRDGS